MITALLTSHGGKEGDFLYSLTSASRLLCLPLGSAAASCLIQVAGKPALVMKTLGMDGWIDGWMMDAIHEAVDSILMSFFGIINI